MTGKPYACHTEILTKNTNLSDLKYEMDIQTLLTLASVSAATIIGEKNKKTNLFKWRKPQKRILKKKVKKETKLTASKTIRFGTYRNIKDKGDNIEIIDYISALSGGTKSPKIILERKDVATVIKKESSKKR
jgi:hypothetical protein